MANDMMLPLHEIIGIPISDMVRAEMQAAQASMEFIQNVGFRRDPKGGDPDNLGELRFVTFRYQSADVSTKSVTHEVKVPLLSLVPLPLLQIARGEIELVARIHEVKPLALDSAVVARDRKSETLVAQRHEFIASVDSLTAADDPKLAAIPRMRIKIEVKQSDLPAGIDSLLRKMDKNVADKAT